MSQITMAPSNLLEQQLKSSLWRKIGKVPTPISEKSIEDFDEPLQTSIEIEVNQFQRLNILNQFSLKQRVSSDSLIQLKNSKADLNKTQKRLKSPIKITQSTYQIIEQDNAKMLDNQQNKVLSLNNQQKLIKTKENLKYLLLKIKDYKVYSINVNKQIHEFLQQFEVKLQQFCIQIAQMKKLSHFQAFNQTDDELKKQIIEIQKYSDKINFTQTLKKQMKLQIKSFQDEIERLKNQMNTLQKIQFDLKFQPIIQKRSENAKVLSSDIQQNSKGAFAVRRNSLMVSLNSKNNDEKQTTENLKSTKEIQDLKGKIKDLKQKLTKVIVQGSF